MTSWNSNQKLACEINFHLIKTRVSISCRIFFSLFSISEEKTTNQITIYFARWLVIRVPRDPVKFSCSLLFDFFYKHLTHRGSSYNDNTVTDDFEICQKFFLKQFLWVLTFNIYQLLSVISIKTVVFIGFKKVILTFFLIKKYFF